MEGQEENIEQKIEQNEIKEDNVQTDLPTFEEVMLDTVGDEVHTDSEVVDEVSKFAEEVAKGEKIIKGKFGHPLYIQKEEEPKEDVVTNSEIIEEEIQRDLSEFMEDKGLPAEDISVSGGGGGGNPQPEGITLGDFIDGAVLLMFLDEALPVVVKYVFGFFNKKLRRLNQKGEEALMLTDKERERLLPFADKLVAVLVVNVRPEVAFAFIYGIIALKKVGRLDDEHFKEVKK